LREAFYVLSTAQDVPDARLLDDVVRRYPQFCEELTEFAIAIAVDALRTDDTVEAAEAAIYPHIVSPAVSRAMSHFQNRLHALVTGVGAPQERPRAKGVDVPNPFLVLSREEFRALTERLNANSVFVCKMRDRQIIPETVPPSFQRRVADELSVPLEVVVAHFGARQTATSGQLFKAESKPSISARQTYEEAVRNSGLTEAQQRSLLEL
jgi:hypothetical protein